MHHQNFIIALLFIYYIIIPPSECIKGKKKLQPSRKKDSIKTHRFENVSIETDHFLTPNSGPPNHMNHRSPKGIRGKKIKKPLTWFGQNGSVVHYNENGVNITCRYIKIKGSTLGKNNNKPSGMSISGSTSIAGQDSAIATADAMEASDHHNVKYAQAAALTWTGGSGALASSSAGPKIFHKSKLRDRQIAERAGFKQICTVDPSPTSTMIPLDTTSEYFSTTLTTLGDLNTTIESTTSTTLIDLITTTTTTEIPKNNEKKLCSQRLACGGYLYGGKVKYPI